MIRWYRTERRSFPWRTTRDPYRILLSEMMLQQTQASRVVAFYRRWLRQFPTFKTLADASTSEVLRAWSGLGYNSRALRLHKLAAIVVQRKPARLPSTPDELQSLPGIGRYTAHAVACFAFGHRVPVVDVNIKRIVTRLTKKVRTPFESVPDDAAWSLAGQLLPKKNAYDWNQALMDLGATICTARKPLCDRCPAAAFCRSHASPVFLSRETPVRKKEPSRNGIPRRLIRGRILKIVQQHPVTARQAAALVWKRYSGRDVVWMESVMKQMSADGLLNQKRSAFSLA